MQIQHVGIPAGPQLGTHTNDPAVRWYSDNPVHVRVVAEQWGVCQFRQHGKPGCGMTSADGAEKWSREEDIADRAEPYGQDVESWSLEHGVKVLW
jgi:hypothetical protein